MSRSTTGGDCRRAARRTLGADDSPARRPAQVSRLARTDTRPAATPVSHEMYQAHVHTSLPLRAGRHLRRGPAIGVHDEALRAIAELGDDVDHGSICGCLARSRRSIAEAEGAGADTLPLRERFGCARSSSPDSLIRGAEKAGGVIDGDQA